MHCTNKWPPLNKTITTFFRNKDLFVLSALLVVIALATQFTRGFEAHTMPAINAFELEVEGLRLGYSKEQVEKLFPDQIRRNAYGPNFWEVANLTVQFDNDNQVVSIIGGQQLRCSRIILKSGEALSRVCALNPTADILISKDPFGNSVSTISLQNGTLEVGVEGRAMLMFSLESKV